MRRLVLFLTMAGCALAQREQPPFALPENVEVRSDVVYSSPGGRDLHLDLYLPRSTEAPRPAVVYIHGGGWRGGNKQQFRRHAAHMAARGFVGACIEYRLSPEAKYPAALDDSKAAIRWVRANAAKYGIDARRVGAAGGSAGGHLVAMLGTASDDSRVAAVAAFNPVLDLAAAARESSDAVKAIVDFLGATYAEKPNLWAEASPVTHVNKHSAPFLFLHGDADKTVPYRQSVEMTQKLKDAGVPAELYTGKGGAHGFFNATPFFEPTLARMEEFFMRVLAAPQTSKSSSR